MKKIENVNCAELNVQETLDITGGSFVVALADPGDLIDTGEGES